MPRGSGVPAAATVLATLTLLVTLGSPVPRAHKAITSKYTFNEHVFPILRDRCGHCHYAGGPTPMSLMTYKEAAPWAESIREQLITQAMPPWYVDPLARDVKGGHAITPKELDVFVTWAVGGAPEGDDTKTPALQAARAGWDAGPPDAQFAMPAPHDVASGTVEMVHEVVIPTTFDQEKWISAVDLLPGTPSMVRAATIALENGSSLASWVPGERAIPAPNGTAFRLPPRAKLRVRIQYRKHWQDEMAERSDRSTIGLYFADRPRSGRGIEALTLERTGGKGDGTAAASAAVATPARVLGITPALDEAYATVAVDAVPPDGRRLTLLRLQAPRPGWSRRYWLAEPVELPAHTRIEIITTQVPEPTGAAAQAGRRFRVALDFAPVRRGL